MSAQHDYWTDDYAMHHCCLCWVPFLPVVKRNVHGCIDRGMKNARIDRVHTSQPHMVYIFFFVMNHDAYAWPLAAMNARRRRTSVRGALPCPRGDVRGWDRGRARHTRAIPPSTTQERGRERPVPRAAAHNGASRDLPRPHRPAELYSTHPASRAPPPPPSPSVCVRVRHRH
jgi:hypothetical protein